jgi:hypothetical protein
MAMAHAVTDIPTTRQTIEGEEVDLETVAEIIEEDIDVVALAVADLQHHRRAAAERP